MSFDRARKMTWKKFNIYRLRSAVREVGFFSWVRFAFAGNSAKVKVTVAGNEIIVRKGSPDLAVALDNLCGEFDILAHLLPRNYDGIIVDAGGYIGTSAIALRQLYPMAKLIVIEPSVDNVAVLRMNLLHIPGVEIICGALVGAGGVDSTHLLDRATGQWGLTVVSKPLDAPNASRLEQVTCYRLADLVPDLGQVGIVKLDIEGGEFDLIVHDKASLAQIPAIYAELHEAIVPGCEEEFFKFSSSRILIKDRGEKYLSIRR